MAMSSLPTPRPDEKLVVILEIVAPEVSRQSREFTEFEAKFTDFKQELDSLVGRNFVGALKMKVLMKKGQESSILYKG
jgi:hypothetical protein